MRSFFPLPDTYAVAQVDVEATLSGISDLDRRARAAAKLIKPAKALVYLHTVNELPFPSRPDYRYMLYLVGPGLRPDNPRLCLASDMCVPIYPNTCHPDATRQPVYPDPSFPYSNCCNWFGVDLQPNVRVKRGEYERVEGKYSALPSLQWVRMEKARGKDNYRSYINQLKERNLMGAEASERREAAESVEIFHLDDDARAGKESAEATHVSDGNPREDTQCSIGQQEQVDDDDDYVASLGSSSDSSDVDWEDSLEDLFKMNLLGIDDIENRDIIPVVDVWLDLTEHFLSEEDIPSPIEFAKQCETLSWIVMQFKERRAARLERQAIRHRVLQGLSKRVKFTIRSLFRRVKVPVATSGIP